MSSRFTVVLGLLSIGTWPLAAPAQAQPREAPPAPFARAIQCRAIADPQERLACYDREVAALEEAERTSQIRVVDRQQVRRSRRTLFGLDIPDLDIFGRDDGEEVSEVSSTLRSVTQNGMGKWIFELEDGARWLQVDSLNIVPDPRPGHTIRIRRAAMGSFLANVNGRRAVRVRRQN
jgi:hypothetical protein